VEDRAASACGENNGLSPAGFSHPASKTARLDATPIIYLVDDDAAVRDSLRLLLETHDRPVRDFAMPGSLLEEANAMPAGCLLLDYQLPGMNGLELLGRLRDFGVEMPAILITGRCDRQLRHRAAAAGVVGVLEKPFADECLLALLARALGEAPGRSAAHT
jgi:two-component system, LuxR family, response regulator FixJ